MPFIEASSIKITAVEGGESRTDSLCSFTFDLPATPMFAAETSAEKKPGCFAGSCLLELFIRDCQW